MMQRPAERAEYPKWAPWWLRYAEFDGDVLCLLDASLRPDDCHRAYRRYVLARGHDKPCSRPEGCSNASGRHATVVKETDSLEEAEAAFAEAEARLLGREEA